MKTTVAVLLAAIFMVASADEERRCTTGHDCDAGECCLRKGFFRRNVCAPLTKESESCGTERVNLGGKYYYNCPCESGLVCEAEEVLDHGILGKEYINERCVSQPRTGEP